MAVDMRVQILVPRRPESRRLIDWIESGTADALKKQYMKGLYFGISRDVEGLQLIEQYHFSVAYSNNATGVKMTTTIEGKKQASTGMKVIDADSVRRELCKMMRMLVTICEHLNEVPEEHYLFMRITYYDHCPDDYEPPFFAAVDAQRFGEFCREPVLFNVGSLRTPHHQTRLKCESILERLSDTEDETISMEAEDAPRRTTSHALDLGTSISFQQNSAQGSEYMSDARMSCEAETVTMSGDIEKENGDLSIKTNHCLSINSSSAPKEEDLLKKVIELCTDRTQVGLAELTQELSDVSKLDINNVLGILVKAGALIQTYRSNSYLVGDLKRAVLSLSCTSEAKTTRIKHEIGILSEGSHRDNDCGILPGSERTDSAVRSEESRCGNHGKSNWAAHAFNRSPVPRSPMTKTDVCGNALFLQPDDDCTKREKTRTRKASYVEEPITNVQLTSKRPRTRTGSRISKMRG